ncbi:uncharacterized protein LOC132280226 [Cornus florida]|uniref:uncharacterized protein LOC132280226 n=1 Tax=Cornus florida TaxID=4283 RepID=UPI00289B5389|nr:uncharacterized protein LOC132280226 [Cornus florida]
MSMLKSIIEEIVGLTEDEFKLIGSHKNDKLVDEIVGLTQDESKLLGINKIGKLVRSLNDIKAAMTRGILLLKVFEKAGVALEKYRQLVQSEIPKEKVVNDIKALLERAGFVINDKDVDLSDIDCESESIKEATEELGDWLISTSSDSCFKGIFQKKSIRLCLIRWNQLEKKGKRKFLNFFRVWIDGKRIVIENIVSHIRLVSPKTFLT